MKHGRSGGVPGTAPLRLAAGLALIVGMLAPFLPAGTVEATTVTSAAFSSSGGSTYNGITYAKPGAAMTLTVNTDPNTQCVELSDGTNVVDFKSSGSQSTWIFTGQTTWSNVVSGSGAAMTAHFTAPSAGAVSITSTAFGNANGQGHCVANRGETPGAGAASYSVDATPPSVTGTLSSSASPTNGWYHTSPVNITWSATDLGGSGIANGPTPPNDSVTADGVTTKTSSATDHAGNTGTGSVTVRLDTKAPTITGSRTPEANSYGWNNTNVSVSFNCADQDQLSGMASCVANNTSSSLKVLSAEGANQSVTGTATDNAGNSASTTVGGINIDKTPPTISGAPTTQPNAAGWYNKSVAVHWTCSDSLSGIAGSCPDDTTISSEGTGQTASASVSDKAGNPAQATSPGVNIDTTAPVTTAVAPPAWNNTDVTITFKASDNLSGVAGTFYQIDGGATQTGTSVTINSEGTHTVKYWSADVAGNTESARTVSVNIDKTPPTIGHSLLPVPNGYLWNNSQVTVTFNCSDVLSQIASCTGPQTVSSEGKNQVVTGTATDNAGNSATDPAQVSVDTTKPSISAHASSAPNGNGWYNADVVVNFTCDDNLSGVLACPQAQTLHEGANQSASAAVYDAAGNTNSTTLSGISIDKTPPTISGAAAAPPNTAGWYSGDVTIHWTCADQPNLSGLDGSCPDDSTISGEGGNLSATASVSDKAGNTAGAAVSGIKIDRTAPTTTASAKTGWQNTPVAVTLSATDNLSGVAATYYTIDGGSQQTGTTFTITADGTHTISYYSVDRAGNTEKAGSITVNVDATPPVIGHTQSPAANANGWNNGPVSIGFACSDNLSGIAVCTDPQTISTEGKGQTVVGTATDNAGNTTTDRASVNIDTTAPTIKGSTDRPPNSAGWYSDDVTVSFDCADALSGVSACTKPVTLGEGANQSVQGTATDAADNSASDSVSGINVDKTPPTLSGAPTSSPNGNGWYNGDVTIAWTCNDPPLADGSAGSGIAVCPADSTITGEGDNLVASGTATDKAGNNASADSGPVNIDRTPPTTTISAPNNWVNSDVTVTLTPSDTLSGVDSTHYTLDGGPDQTGTSFTISTEGTHTITFWSVDKAGNEEAHHTATVLLDKSAPTVTHSLSPAPNAHGWNNSDVTVTFVCSDVLSGVATCPDAQTLTGEGKDQKVTGTGTDKAGNSATDTATVSIDKTPPTISASTDQKPNGNAWYNTDVTVGFKCDDALSGIDTCSDPVTLGEGASQSATGTAVDAAGNSSQASLTGINVDETAPTLSGAATSPPNDNGWYNGNVTVHWTCGDALSGVDTCPADTTVTGEGDSLSATGTATDKAGNSTTSVVSGIKIDRTAPTTVSDAPKGWQNTSVTVNLTASDTLSGVASTHYTVDGGAEHTGTTVTIDTEGAHTLTYWSVDNAGNSESPQSVLVQVDTTSPTVQETLSAQPNSAGWINSDVTVSFTCGDNLSGVATCSSPQTVNTEGAGQVVTGHATDNANNASDNAVTLNVDKTPPSIQGALDREANSSGWYNNDVTVRFSCDDNLSGVAACSSPTTLGEGADQSVTGNATDLAGNTAATTMSGINVDKTGPSLSWTPTSPANGNGWYNGDVTVHWTCGDSLSGVAVCPGDSQITSAGDNLTTTATAVDVAGNQTTVTAGPFKIDRLPPTTEASVPNNWTNNDVNVSLTATDNLSGVASTHYSIDGGADQTGTDFTISTEGTHTIKFWSVDNAGNQESVKTVLVHLDKTAPTITHTRQPPANQDGWNNGDVTVTFQCSDDTSGVAKCIANDSDGTSPSKTVSSEGKDMSVTGLAEDNAGNTATDQAMVSIDKTPPTIGASPDRPANAYNWYNQPVTISFSCVDGLSGVAACSGPGTIDMNGNDKSVTGSATDLAGNSITQTLGGGLGPAITLNGQATIINFDKTPPTLSGAPTSQPNGNGWYKGDVTVHWTCGDALSGVDTCPVDTTVTGEGSDLSVTATDSDKAGNVTTATAGGIKIDRTAPTTTSDAPLGWVNGARTVHLTATDNLSGVDTTYYTVDGGAQASGSTVTVSGEGVHTIKFWSVDKAGNTEAAQTALVHVDTTAPTITGAATTQPDSSGWYTKPVTIHFTCSDPKLADGNAGSGIATCQPDVTLTNNGSSQTVNGSATDNAGNSATATVSGLNVDTAGPTITSVSVAARTGSSNGAMPVFTLGNVPAPTCQATDAASGVASCQVAVSGGQPNGVGIFSYTATATDKAGNTTQQTGQYQVVYNFSGFLQPICDTAHQTSGTSCSTSIFKAGQTIPVKFQLTDASGKVVQASAAPQWLKPVAGAPLTAAVNQQTVTAGPTSGSTFQYSGGQYQYNWNTSQSQAGTYWTIGVVLDDNTTHTVNIGLR